MSTRFKLRVCTWNVGNAAPPADLTTWLGLDQGPSFDIIVVGAQEANYSSSDKTALPSPLSTTVHGEKGANSGQQQCEGTGNISTNYPSTSAGAASTGDSKRILRKLSRVLRVAKGSRRDSQRKSGTEKNEEQECGDVSKTSTADWRSENKPGDSPKSDGQASPLEAVSNQSTKIISSDALSTSSHDNDSLSSLIDENNALVQATALVVDGDEFFRAGQNPNPVMRARQSPELDESPLEKRVLVTRRQLAVEEEFSHSREGEQKSCPSDDDDDFLLCSEYLSKTESRADRENFSVPMSPCSPAADGIDVEKNQQRAPMTYKKEDSQNLSSIPSPESPAQPEMMAIPPIDTQQQGESNNATIASSKEKFSRCVRKNMPKEYHLVAKHHLMEIKLLVFVHERLKGRIVKTESMSEATGIGNVVGNKGGVAVKLTLDGTSFCFVSSHLAAHEGAKYLQQRNQDVFEIMRNIERNKVHGLPAIHQFHHLFWMGDLNYRLDVTRVLPASITWSHAEKWDYIREMIASGRYAELTQFDELVHEMELEHVFANFTEGKISFSPTFKVTRGKASNEYQSLRLPSYCDRILWHSLPLHQNHIKLKEYGAIPAMDTSDHKPVYAVFDLVIPKRIRHFPMPAPRDTLKCTIDFIRLRLHGLYEKNNWQENGSDLKYEVLEDGALSLAIEDIDEPDVSPRPTDQDRTKTSPMGTASHTRRLVRVDFHGAGMFVRQKPHRAEVPVKDGGFRECQYDELPKIALQPIESLSDLTYKYVTIVFTRIGSRQGSSCVLPLANLVQNPGKHRVNTELFLTKYGHAIAKVEVEAELVVSMETWIDSNNKIVKPRER